MASKIKGITIELNANATKLDKALKDVNKASKTTQDNLKAVDKALKFDPTNTELLTQKQRLLADAVNDAAQKVELLKKKQAEMAEAVKNGTATQQEYDTLTRQLMAAEGQLDKATKASDGFNVSVEKMKGHLEKASGALGTAAEKTKGFSAAAGGVVAGLAGLAIKAGQTADEINELSVKTGLSTDTLQEMQYAADLVDVEVSTITGSLSKLTKTMTSARKGTGSQAEAFAKLGVKVEGSNGQLRDNEEVFYDVLEALSQVEDETERDSIAMEIFGKSAQELNPIIQDGGKQLKELGKEAKDAGLIMSKDALNGANRFNDALDKMKATAQGTMNTVGADLAEALTPLIEKLGEWVSDILKWVRDLGADRLLSILKIAAIVAAVSPVLSLLSKISNGLTLILTHPLIAGAVAITALIVGIAKAISDANQPASLLGEEFHELADKIAEAKGRIEGYTADVDTATEAIEKNSGRVSETFKPYEDLAERLGKIVDSQGKVKKGYEEEAKTIIDTLKGALDIEIEINNGVIKSYEGTQKAIYDTIRAKKAQAILDANADEYADALERQVTLSNELRDATSRYKTVTDGLNETSRKREILERQINWLKTMDLVNNNELYEQYEALQAELEQVSAEEAFYGSQLQAVSGELQAANEAYNRNANIIANYDRVVESSEKGLNNLDLAIMALSNNMRTAADADEKTLQKQLEDYEKAYADMKYAVETNGAKIPDAQFENLEKMIEITKTELEKARGEFVRAYDDWNSDFYNVGTNVVQGIADGINAKSYVAENAASGMARRVADTARAALAVNSPSKVFAEIGKYTDEGLAKGVLDNLDYVERATAAMTNTLKGVDAGVASTSEGAQVMAAGVGRQPIVINMTQPIYLGGKTVGNAVTESVIENINAQQELQAAFVGV